MPAFQVVVLAFSLLHGALCYEYWIEDCSPSVNHLRPDPCRPGGKWDELLKRHVLQCALFHCTMQLFLCRCNGYFGRDCYQCYDGDWCQNKQDVDNCTLSAVVHTPVAFDEYWAQLAGQPCIHVPAGFRMSYQANEYAADMGMMLIPLDTALRELHAFVGNAETDGYIIFPSFGATQGVVAALYAVSQQICEEYKVEKADVFAQRPYYSHFEWLANYSLQTTRWNPDADPQSPTTIEIVTWPNNPDGRKLQPLQPDPKRRVYDLSFYWPTYTDIERKLSEEIMVFSGSKHSGLSATRGGWLLAKDPKFIQGVISYILNTTIGVSVDTQLRLLAHAKHIVENHSSGSKEGIPHFYDFMGNMTRARFAELDDLFAETEDYELVNAKTMGGLAWIKCKEGYSCPGLFAEVGLIGSSGLYFGANDSYVRFSMALPDVEYATFVQKIKMRLTMAKEPLTNEPPSHLKIQHKRNAGFRSFP